MHHGTVFGDGLFVCVPWNSPMMHCCTSLLQGLQRNFRMIHYVNWPVPVVKKQISFHCKPVYMYEDDLQLGKLKGNCLLLKLYLKLRKMFLSPRRETNPQPSDLQWDALTIELPGLRWQWEGHDMYRFVSATLFDQLKMLSAKYKARCIKRHHYYNQQWSI